MSSLQNLRKLLAGSDFQGVGRSTVERIVAAFGETLYEVLDQEDRGRLREVTTDNKVDALIDGWRKVVAQQKIVRWLDRYGIEPSIAATVLRLWGNHSLEKLEANPYRLLAMASWNIVDRLAKRLGVPVDHPVRLVGAAEQAVYTHIDEDGSTWIRSHDLKVAITKLLGRRWDNSLPPLDQASSQAIKLAVETQALLPVDSGFQVPGAFFTERQIEDWIQHRVGLLGSSGNFSETIESFQRSEGVTLTEEQCKAVSNALGYSISTFYGGAGVGKTFVIKAICTAAELLGKRTLLLALAAKAVRKMASSTGRDAMTLSRALHRRKVSDFANTVIVIDEFSMVDMLDFRCLIQRLPENAQLVLCDDAAQLPSIGPGRLLYSFINSGLIPAQELTTTHRQAAETGIPQKLLSIRNGTLPPLPLFDWDHCWMEGIFLVPCDWKTLPPLVTRLYDRFEGEAQIISPLAESTVGVKALNREIHQHVAGTWELRPNTPVVFTANTALSSGMKVVNGLQGHVKTVINANPRHPDLAYIDVEVENERIVCSLRDVESFLELAYALTVHRAQGSDWETIIAVLPPSRLLARAMVYTALSRCKQRCIVLAPDLRELGKAVANPPSYETREDRLFHESKLKENNSSI